MTDPANLVPPHLLAYIDRHAIDVEFVAPGVPMPTVAAAAAAIGAAEEHILKTLLFASGDRYVVAIANGTRRVSRDRLATASGLAKPRAAGPDVVEPVTGYPAGGVAPIGLPEHLPVIVDTGVAALPMAFAGAGRDDVLLRISPLDIIRLNRAVIWNIAEEP